MTLRTVHTKTEKTNSIYPSTPKPFPPPIKITTIFYMILSASRRTDIPAFFSDWFYKRIEEGFFYGQKSDERSPGVKNFRFSAKCRVFCFLDKKSV